MRQTIIKEELYFVLQEMAEYVKNCDDCEKANYLAELSATGLFHDVMGKVVEVTDNNEVIVETEY